MQFTEQAHTSLEILLAAKSRSSDEIEALVRVGSLLNSTLDPKAVLRVAMEEAAEAVKAEASAILLIDDTTGDLVFEVATGNRGEQTKEIRLRQGEGVAGWVVQHKRPVRVDDARDDPRFAGRVDKKTAFLTRSILCVPLKVKDRMTGVLEVINKRDRQTFSENDEDLLILLSHLVATAIDNAQLYRKVYEEKETLRAVLDSMADGVLVVDCNNEILLHNHAVLNLLAVDPEDLSLESFGDEHILAPVERLVSQNKHYDSFQLDLPSGEDSITLANRSTLLKDPSGEVTGAVIVMRDATERARLEKMKNDFIATTSHKLRTPLTSILGFATILQMEDLQQTHPEDGQDPVRSAAIAIEEQGRRLHKLIEKLLGFTGMELGTLQLERRPVDSGSLVAEASLLVQERASAKSVQINCKSQPDPIEISVDGQKIMLVLTNLLENAIKFGSEKSTIGAGAEILGNEIRFWVSDEGPGIPEEEQDRIFEKFYQIDRDLTGQIEGAGLGLALCRNIVTAHGGRIEVESKRGQGSTFNVYLPSANRNQPRES